VFFIVGLFLDVYICCLLLVTPVYTHCITHMMQDTGRKYVRYINSKYKRTGSLWDGRYKASLIDSEVYMLTCMRYIKMNPVRANMVSHPGGYRWSSYRSNSGHDSDPLLEQHSVYKLLDLDDEQRQYAYRELFGNSLSTSELHDIREALNQELVLEREDFKDKIGQITQRQSRPGKPGGPSIEESRAVYYLY
jgi:putative transposase